MKNIFLKSALPAALLLVALTACKKDPMEPIPNPVPPQQQLPNPLPAFALIDRLQWAETDYNTYAYNTQNQPSRYYVQWQFVQGDPTKIHSLTYDFQYDAQHKPVELNYANGWKVKYYYQGDLIKKTQEFASDGILHTENEYVYQNGRITGYDAKIYDGSGEPPVAYRHVFNYDQRGNLTKEETYEILADQTLALRQTLEFKDFDNKINPTSWTILFPYLPQLRWQFNNPGKEILTLEGGAPQTITYSYEYNTQGLPLKKVKTGPGGSLNADYSY